jgi:hypothetical protein
MAVVFNQFDCKHGRTDASTSRITGPKAVSKSGFKMYPIGYRIARYLERVSIYRWELE